jgi:hypothetical protein
MVAAVGVQVTQAEVLVVTAGSDVRVSQLSASAVYNFPSEGVRASQMQATAVTDGANDVRVSQAQVLAVVRGRIDNHRVRAWTYSMDGHDFYVLQLGETGTIICDLTTGQWSQWKSDGRASLRAVLGTNWTGIGAGALISGGHRANVVAGDDTYGLIWFLAPEQGYDERADDDTVQQTFERIAMAGVPMRGRDTARCNEVYLLANKGADEFSVEAQTVRLRTSDDAEKTWTDQGTITITPEEYEAEYVWRSLGIIGSPGRVFEITDNCLARIDGLEMY